MNKNQLKTLGQPGVNVYTQILAVWATIEYYNTNAPKRFSDDWYIWIKDALKRDWSAYGDWSSLAKIETVKAGLAVWDENYSKPVKPNYGLKIEVYSKHHNNKK